MSKPLKKTIIAHRGASGYLPEHSLESKAMAHAMDVDFIEQDLVLSKDDIPIVIHDIYLDDVTDVATKYPNRKRADGRYYVIDFTFKELQSLNTTERFDPKTGSQVYAHRFPKSKGNFRLHSLQEEIELIQGLNASRKKNIGIYPEIKNPAFHHKHKKNIARIVINILDRYGYRTKNDACRFQCFDAKELERVRTELNSNLFLVQLLDTQEEQQQLAHFASYADGIGPWYGHLLKGKDKNGTWQFNDCVQKAHDLNMVVHPYTFRADELGPFTSFEEQLETFFTTGKIDGVFTDFPDLAVQFLSKRSLQ